MADRVKRVIAAWLLAWAATMAIFWLAHWLTIPWLAADSLVLAASAHQPTDADAGRLPDHG